jgi:hypothetical protein
MEVTGMRHRLIGTLVVFGFVAGTAARADSASGGVEASTGTFNIQVGLKWSPLRYTHPIGAPYVVGAGGDPNKGPGMGTGPIPGSDCGGGSSESSNRSDCMYGFQTTSLDSYIGFFFHPQIGAILALDLGYGSYHADTNTATVGAQPTFYNTSYFQFGFAIGGKFYLTRPTGMRVSPYLYVDFFKYFASISTDRAVSPDIVGAQAGLHSPLGFDLAFGAEYFFTNSFSLGAEVIGFRFAYVEGDYTAGTPTTTTEKDLYFTLYTAITLNYRFLASASVRLEADVEATEETKRPAKRPRARPRPAPAEEGAPTEAAPTPSPESVD